MVTKYSVEWISNVNKRLIIKENKKKKINRIFNIMEKFYYVRVRKKMMMFASVWLVDNDGSNKITYEVYNTEKKNY